MRDETRNRATPSEADRGGLASEPRRLRPCSVSPEDEREFMRAMEDYKFQSGRQFPTWSEILEVLQNLGYAKRIWRPIGPAAPGGHFEAIGEDSVTGVLCWYSRVETPSGSRSS